MWNDRSKLSYYDLEELITLNKGGTNAKQVGLGAKLSSINKVMSQGNALSTGRSLDICIDGEGDLILGIEY